MITWVASYPRSGNTFLRIVLRRVYELETAVVYDVDGVAERIGKALVGYRDLAADYEELRSSPELHLVKTHNQRRDPVQKGDPAICLVRDGRDSIVSYARLRVEECGGRFEDEVRAAILRPAESGVGGWGRNVLSWLADPDPAHAVLRYEDLVASPLTSVGATLDRLGLDVKPADDATVPTFAELQRTDSGFFRRGRTGSHRDELPDELHELFWSVPDNRAAMELLGYLP
ncbi:sulfotransferase domain-containing protein [Tenggerimyces flavus]|uniref:Sulfotransferase domain-containing protein n=1 Tax=Tenggerimyces flavus TaxID=1708749 RepID=A0ABV7Y6T2_9ACTN|nr:sulfotransferase domain-containing protein [Tenggerimyces flavus]MBM7788373.1 hypothetical protein [Tenggerimyces flavus]